MSAQNPSFAQEVISAADGSWRLLIGRREAPGYFTTDLRGLVSSFLALLVVVAITLVLNALTAPADFPLTSFDIFSSNALLYLAMTGASWVALKFLGKQDMFIPYLAVDNWINAVLQIALALLGLINPQGDFVLLIALVAGLAARINNARLVVGLKAGGIVILIIAQMIGILIGLMFVGSILGPALQ